MKIQKLSFYITAVAMVFAMQTASCQNKKTDDDNKVSKSYYESMKGDVMAEPDANFMDSSNVFSSANYIPSKTMSDEQLITLGQVFRLDSTMIVKFDIRTPEQLNGQMPEDTLVVGEEYFTRDLHDITESELSSLRHNLDMVNNFKSNPESDGGCSGEDCPVYAHIDKGNQLLSLYINGELVDTFKTSTARKGYETPNFSKRPDGRMFKKYTSHKYPHGDWNGLGNMPYAVFVQGGYAVHGATTGEIRQLGHPASHGCIRIHPKNAKIFYNLVRYAGPENTWIKITD